MKMVEEILFGIGIVALIVAASGVTIISIITWRQTVITYLKEIKKDVAKIQEESS